MSYPAWARGIIVNYSYMKCSSGIIRKFMQKCFFVVVIAEVVVGLADEQALIIC